MMNSQGCTDDSPSKDGQEDKTVLTAVETMILDKHEWKCRELNSET